MVEGLGSRKSQNSCLNEFCNDIFGGRQTQNHMKARGDPMGLARDIWGTAPECARSKGVWAIFFGVSPSLAHFLPKPLG